MTTISITPVNTAEINLESSQLSPEDIEFVEKFWEAEIMRDPAFANMSEEEYFTHFEELCSRCCSPEELGLDCNVNNLMCRSRQCSHLKPLSDREVGEMMDSLEQSLRDGTLSFDLDSFSQNATPWQ